MEDLVSLDVSTVSRKEERWWSAPAGVDVVTGEEIRRAGVQNIEDALRLATGVDVAQSSAKSWAISLRGMDVLAANKISVVMDGRSLYTPFYSGVLWDQQDVMLEDVDRIEVVRGPVGALWGSYAVNGLIQILTKPAWDTQGWLVSAGAGTEDPGFVSLRYGGKIGENTFYRVYAKYSQTDWTYLPTGGHAQPATDFFQTGFRIDSLRQPDTTLTLQGDFHTNEGLPLDSLQNNNNTGANLLARWHRTYSTDSDLTVESYYDHTYWIIPQNFSELRDTGSLSIKYHFPDGRNYLLVGTDAMISHDDVGNIGIATLQPASTTTHKISTYVQDTISLVPDRTALTLGLEGEENSFSSGYEFQPTIRFAWTPSPQTTVWAAVSRAVRTPVRIDQDLQIQFAGVTFFQATDAFKTEQALAYEIGFRRQPVSARSPSTSRPSSTPTTTSAARNPPGPRPSRRPSRIPSMPIPMARRLTVMYQPVFPALLQGQLPLPARGFLQGRRQPRHQQRQRRGQRSAAPRHDRRAPGSSGNIEFDAFLRCVSSLPNPATPGYTAMDLRLGWRPTPRWEFSVSGRNLLDQQHRELITTNSLNEEVHQSCTLKVTWRY